MQVDDAEACYKEAIKLAPSIPWILNAYGSLLADQVR
jgi:Tfp pilus assembly protein PilF